MLSHLQHLEGIESIVIEDRNREYVEERRNDCIARVSATMASTLPSNGARHHIDMMDLVVRSITVYRSTRLSRT